MLKEIGKISSVLVLVAYFLSCGDVDKVNPVLPEDNLAINGVLQRWREGYETEDVDTYMSAYWSQGFRYVSDMGTDGDKTDDLVFDDIRDERDSAIRVFSKFQDIEIELSKPPEIFVNKEGDEAEVRNHYRIQGFVADGESLEGGYNGWFAEGDNLFLFEKRDDEWRIAEWHDEAFNDEEIRSANNL
jgi:ketosteroid isomerase-like protein